MSPGHHLVIAVILALAATAMPAKAATIQISMENLVISPATASAKVGDTVERDEPLFEISTDKVDAEIPSPAAGRGRRAPAAGAA